jgi:hypothetical protein
MFFESIRRGFGFLGQAVDMARKDGDLIKPSFYGLVVGFVVSIASAVPILAGVFLFNTDSGLGQAALFITSALAIFAQYAVAYIFSGMTAYLVYGYLAEGDGRMDKAWEIVRRDWFDILTLAAASTVVKLVENALRGRGGRRNLLGGILANILETVWTTATFFILPAMVIEDLNLAQGVKRATHIIKNNLLLVAVTEIGVGWVMGLISFLLVVIALIIGGGVFFVFASAGQTGAIMGIVLAVVIAGSLLALISALSSYVTTAYHTCLFIWARSVEQAVTHGQTMESVHAPAPVAAVLGV